MIGVSSTDELARSALIHTADMYFWCLIWSTVILFAGAIMEEFNPFKYLPAHTVNFRTRLRSPRRWVLRLRKWYKHLAVWMVIGGIGGEGIFEYLVAHAESAVRELDNRVTLSARTAATAALDRATEAEAILQPRSIALDQARDIRASLKSLAGLDLWIGSHWIDPESARLAGQIKSALNGADIGLGPNSPADMIGKWPSIPTGGATPGWGTTFRVPDIHTGIEIWGKERKVVAETIRRVAHLDAAAPEIPSPFGETDNLVVVFVA